MVSSSQTLLRQQDIPQSRRLMYLEDGGPEEGQPSPSSSSWSPADGSSSTPAAPLSEEEMVRRILTGYDSAQAAALSSAEGRWKYQLVPVSMCEMHLYSHLLSWTCRKMGQQ